MVFYVKKVLSGFFLIIVGLKGVLVVILLVVTNIIIILLVGIGIEVIGNLGFWIGIVENVVNIFGRKAGTGTYLVKLKTVDIVYFSEKPL